MQFSLKDYKEKLKHSNSIEECRKLTSPAMESSNRDYVFISYSHKDYKQVYSVLADLYSENICFWYDRGLRAGKSWIKEVEKKIHDPHCKGVLFFISENFFFSESAYIEVCIALGKDFNRNPVEYFSINLESRKPSELVNDAASSLEYEVTRIGNSAAKENDLSVMSAERKQTLIDAFPDNVIYLNSSDNNFTYNLIDQVIGTFRIFPDPYDFSYARFVLGSGVTIDFENGSHYVGDLSNHRLNGYGELESSAEKSAENYRLSNDPLQYFSTSYLGGVKYKGNWLDGKPHGYGEMTYPNGNQYAGDWVNGEIHGYGEMTYPNGNQYAGDWANGEIHGYGEMTYPNGDQYAGNWANGLPDGKGGMRFANQDLYSGIWVKGKLEGVVTILYNDGRKYEGDCLNLQPHGTGIMMYSDGTEYSGEWEFGMRNGYGTFTCASMWVDFEYKKEELVEKKRLEKRHREKATRTGLWENDVLKEGSGYILYEDGSCYNGKIRNDKRHGVGIYITADGSVQDGAFENDEFLG